MILTALAAVAYRVHVPKWSYAPVSGAGAGSHGGRANRPGIDALYLSLEMETALAEYQQLDPLLPPGLIVTYHLAIDPIVDFRGGFHSGWDPLWEEFYCDWRKLHFNDGVEPPSWLIGDEVLAAGGKGILFNSAMPGGGTNIVLYTEVLTDPGAIVVHDPAHDLPISQDSWR